MVSIGCLLLAHHLLVDEVFVLQDEVDLGGRGRSLQLLTVEHFLLQLLDGLSNKNNRNTLK